MAAQRAITDQLTIWDVLWSCGALLVELPSNNQSSVLPLDILVQPRVPCEDSYADVQTLRDFLHVSAYIYHISVEYIICNKRTIYE